MNTIRMVEISMKIQDQIDELIKEWGKNPDHMPALEVVHKAQAEVTKIEAIGLGGPSSDALFEQCMRIAAVMYILIDQLDHEWTFPRIMNELITRPTDEDRDYRQIPHIATPERQYFNYDRVFDEDDEPQSPKKFEEDMNTIFKDGLWDRAVKDREEAKRKRNDEKNAGGNSKEK